MIENIVIIALFIQGIHYAMSFDTIAGKDGKMELINKEVLWFVKYYGYIILHKPHLDCLKKPIFDCTVCMSSFWGTILYFLLYLHDLKFISWVVVVVAVAGLNRLITSIIYK